MISSLFLLALPRLAALQGIPGWVKHGNRTLYEIDVNACSTRSHLRNRINALDDQMPYLQSLGAKGFILDGVPKELSLSKEARSSLDHLAFDLHSQDFEVLINVGQQKLDGLKRFDGQVVTGDQSYAYFPNSGRKKVSAATDSKWPISSLEPSDWKAFLEPAAQKHPTWPASLTSAEGWIQSSPPRGQRLFSLFNGNLNLIKQALVYLFTTQRAPIVQYGDEIGLAEEKGMMIWDQSRQNLDLLNFLQTLTQIRGNRESLAQGDLKPIPIDGARGVVAFQRTYRFETTVVVWNTRNRSMDANLIVNGFANHDIRSLLDGSDQGSYTFSLPVTIAAHGVMILAPNGM